MFILVERTGGQTGPGVCGETEMENTAIQTRKNEKEPVRKDAKMGKLRSGYTTGTCAAAAAKAAAVFMLTGKRPKEILVHMPEGKESVWAPLPSEEPELSGFWKVQKDSGDDPDVTNGVWVYAKVSPMDSVREKKFRDSGTGYWLEQYPGLYLDGGRGIGLVTKQGLSCPVGHYAINPVPREMILSAVAEVCREAGYEEGLLVEIAIPAGTVLAEKTFNPRLGIKGGISVLGTTGIVRPMSEEALVETIRLDIRMKAMSGKKLLIMTPGNYGETFLKERLNIELGEAVVCSNFAADAVDMIRECGMKNLLFAGHLGKLIKVAYGARNTHSRYGDGRMETMEAMTRNVLMNKTGVKQPDAKKSPEPAEAIKLPEAENSVRADDLQRLCSRIRGANTTEEAVDILKQCHLAQAVMTETAGAVKRQMEQWSGDEIKTEVIVFSSAHQVIGMTRDAPAFLEQWKKGQKNRVETLRQEDEKPV